MARLYRFKVSAAQAGQRLDLMLVDELGAELSRTRIQRLIRDGDVTVDGKAAKPGQTVTEGQDVIVFVPPSPPPVIQPEALQLDVRYEDDDVIVINKPRGMVVHPAPGHETGTLVNALLAYSDDLSAVAGSDRPGIVHRLDKDTTGLILVAKNDAAHRTLSAELKKRLIDRHYLAVVHGVPEKETAIIEAPIGRHPIDRQRMMVTGDGRPAWTKYWLLEKFDTAFSLLELKLFTGRTHQIRVHMAYLGHPILGDRQYGPRQVPRGLEILEGQALHAYYLSFTHPRTRERISITCPPPDDFRQAVAQLRARYGSELTEEGRRRAQAGASTGRNGHPPCVDADCSRDRGAQ